MGFNRMRIGLFIVLTLCLAGSFLACHAPNPKSFDPSAGTTTLPGPPGYGFDPNLLLADFVIPGNPNAATAAIEISTVPGERAFPESEDGRTVIIFAIDQAQYAQLQTFCAGSQWDMKIIINHEAPSFPAYFVSDDYAVVDGALTTAALDFPSASSGTVRIMAGFSVLDLNGSYFIDFTRSDGMLSYAQIPSQSGQTALLQGSCQTGF